jgi:hypothetical protein
VSSNSGGATFAPLGFVDINEAGQIAFQTTLSDANLGLPLVWLPPAVPGFRLTVC